MSIVYWIRLPDHDNIATQGYVGITCLGVDQRFKLHKQAKPRNGRKPTRIMNCIKKYGDRLICETVLEGSREYCLFIENKLRSSENIGWNLAIGGVAPHLGKKMSEESIKKSADKRRGAKRTNEMVLANKLRAKEQFEAYKNEWDHPHSNKTAWRCALDIYNVFASGGIFGRRSISKLFNIGPDSAMKVVNKIKAGWIPIEDPDWASFKNKEAEYAQT